MKNDWFLYNSLGQYAIARGGGEGRYRLKYYEKYKKRPLLRCIHHFKSDLINNMDHMRISGK